MSMFQFYVNGTLVFSVFIGLNKVSNHLLGILHEAGKKQHDEHIKTLTTIELKSS